MTGRWNADASQAEIIIGTRIVWVWRGNFSQRSTDGADSPLVEAIVARRERESREKREADKRLIDAAPDLLASLRKALTWMQTYKRFNNVGETGPLAQDIAEVRAVIAKAEGHS
jgi:hypothetical protein